MENYNSEEDQLNKIKSLNNQLAQKIKQLETVNTELEAFTYSVSHDLRAPLRAIHGYTRILEEEYDAKFDEDGKRMMAGVIQNAKKMGQLIDDLLALSRMGKKEIVKTRSERLKHSNLERTRDYRACTINCYFIQYSIEKYSTFQ